ncbi:RDD family protein [Psychroserpens sp.]
MQKLNKWLLNNVFGVSLYLAISSLLFQFANFYNLDFNGLVTWIHSFFNFSYANFDFFRIDIFNVEIYLDERSFVTWCYLDLVFYILFLIAAIVYNFSKYKELKVLKFCFSLMFLFSILSIMFQLHRLVFDFENTSLLSIVYFAKAIFMFYVCYFYLMTWKSQRVYIDTEKMSLPDFKTFTLKRAEWYQRLLHYLLDMFLILCIFSKYIFEFYFGALIESLSDMVGERFAASIVFFIFSTFYFLVFEGFFKSTPAKYLSQTSVVNLKNEAVSFANILGRTLCRRIPFDVFSFFGKIGWHDSLAYSTVANHEKEPSKYKSIYIVYIILLIVLFLYKFAEEFRLF